MTNILNWPEYKVLQVKELEHDYQIHAEVESPPRRCINCQSSNLVGFGRREEVILDTPIHGKRAGIWVDRRRYQCRDCSRTFYEPLPHRDEKRLLTTRLISYIEKQSLCRTFASLAEETGLDEKTIRNVFRDYVNRLEKKVRFEVPRWMGIDEIHIIKKPRCVISNIEQRTLVDILPNRTKPTVIRYLSGLKSLDKIQCVAMDMWRPYRDAVTECIPHARIIVDKFHVIRMANDAMERTRKDLRASLSAKQRRSLMRERFVLLKRRSDLSMPEEISFSSWTKNFPVLGEAYDLKESFYGIWDNQNRSQAEKACLAWKAEIPPELRAHFAPLLTAIDNWWDEIFNYFEYPITNAYTESLNSLIRVMNRLGRGYSFDALRAKILFTEGVQKVKRPNYRRQPLPAAAFGRSVAVPLPEPINYGADISTIAQLLGGEDF